jgi:hypothetical protein
MKIATRIVGECWNRPSFPNTFYQGASTKQEMVSQDFLKKKVGTLPVLLFPRSLFQISNKDRFCEPSRNQHVL